MIDTMMGVTWSETDGETKAPAVEAVEWEAHKFSLEDRIQEKGSFSGKPRPDLDEAWHDLLNGE